MGLFNKGDCCVCEKSCNLFNYQKLADGIICKECVEELKEQGLINSFEDLEDVSVSKIKYRLNKANEDITEIVPVCEPDIILKKGEVCYYMGDAFSFHEKNVVTGYVRQGGSRGVRIMKGLTIGRSVGVNTAIRENVVERYPGKFYITNKRIILIAKKYGFELNSEKITSVKNYSNAFEFFYNEKTYTVLTNEVKYIVKLCSLISQLQGNN